MNRVTEKMKDSGTISGVRNRKAVRKIRNVRRSNDFDVVREDARRIRAKIISRVATWPD